MEYVVICLVALTGSGLTLFSGFGLGTVLMPAFALFFPVPVAVPATAVVHLANNLFKTALVGRHADWSVVARFAVPGAVAAVVGAALLGAVAGLPPLWAYRLLGQDHQVTPVRMVIGAVIVAFAFFEVLPRAQRLAFDRKYLPLGGLASGFFGGLSGHQGALRSAFLIKAGLGRDAFIGTGTVSAVVVDVTRLLIYGWGFYATQYAAIGQEVGGLVTAAMLSAFLGAFLGARGMKKVTLRGVQMVVGAMLVLVGLGMASGLI